MGRCCNINKANSGPFTETNTCKQNPLSCCAAASGECCCCCGQTAAPASAAALVESTKTASYNKGNTAAIREAATGPRSTRRRRSRKMHAGRKGGSTSKFAPSTSNVLPSPPAACQDHTRTTHDDPQLLTRFLAYCTLKLSESVNYAHSQVFCICEGLIEGASNLRRVKITYALHMTIHNCLHASINFDNLHRKKPKALTSPPENAFKRREC